MSFCVNCGVRLGDAERKCPLCGVQVINPVRPFDPDAPRPYPDPIEAGPIKERFDRRTIASIITSSLALPALLTAAVDLIYGGSLSWSLYVIGAVVMVWVFSALPLLHSRAEARNRGLLSLLVPDSVALLTYLWVIERLAAPDKWFIRLALPIAGTVCLLLILNAFLIEHRILRGLTALVGLMLSASVMVVVIEIATEFNLDKHVSVTWSLFVVIPCVILSIILLILGRNRSFSEDMARRLHL
jgi:hypothetical protein